MLVAFAINMPARFTDTVIFILSNITWFPPYARHITTGWSGATSDALVVCFKACTIALPVIGSACGPYSAGYALRIALGTHRTRHASLL